jgi:hypothetical protein
MLKNVDSIFQGLSESLLSLNNRQERLTFCIGKSSKPVVAIKDGSIIIEYCVRAGHIGSWGINSGGRPIKPIVSIEVVSCCLPLTCRRQNVSGKRGYRQIGVMPDKFSVKCLDSYVIQKFMLWI